MEANDNPMAVPLDGEQIEAFLDRGDEAAFSALASRYVNMVYGVCYRILGGDHFAAQDAVQSVFLTLARKLESLRNHENLGGWLHRTASYFALSMHRNTKRRTAMTEELKADAADAFLAEPGASIWTSVRESLDEAIQALAPPYRDCLVMHYFQGLTTADIAAATGAPVKTIYDRLDRAREKLRNKLAHMNLAVSGVILTQGLEMEGALRAPEGLANRCAEAVFDRLAQGSLSSPLGGSGGRWLLKCVAGGAVLAGVATVIHLWQGAESVSPTPGPAAVPPVGAVAPVVPAPKPAGPVRYVDGPTILANQPQRDLVKWEALTRGADGRRVREEPQAQGVKLVGAIREGREIVCLAYEGGLGKERNRVLCLKQPIRVPAYSVEWDSFARMVGSSSSLLTLDVTTYTNLLSSPETEVTAAVGQWVHRRYEILPAPEGRPPSERELRLYVRGKLVYRGLVDYDSSAVAIEASGTRWLIDNVVVRELIPVPVVGTGRK